MKIEFAKLNPTQNMTVLVTSPVARADQAGVAAALMAYGGVYAEQVGFLEAPSNPAAPARLQMMGGEFCGNATMSLAALLARKEGLSRGMTKAYSLEVSGAEGLVRCAIEHAAQGFIGTVEMPLPERVETVEIAPGVRAPLVCFPGIAHVLIPEGRMSDADAQAFARELCARLKADALGVLQLDAQNTRMRPLVYVRATDSGVWEHGCGSGSAAVGAWAAQAAQRDARLCLQQPGGSIVVQAEYGEGRVRRVTISGSVRIVCTGEAEIEA